MGHSRGAHRHAVLRCPARLADDSAAEHPGRFLEAWIAARALQSCGVQRAMPAATGRSLAPPVESAPGAGTDNGPCDRPGVYPPAGGHRVERARRLAVLGGGVPVRRGAVWAVATAGGL
jgi:hypothetical protein